MPTDTDYSPTAVSRQLGSPRPASRNFSYNAPVRTAPSSQPVLSIPGDAPRPRVVRSIGQPRGGSGGTIRTSSGLTRVVPPTAAPGLPANGPSQGAMDYLRGAPAPYVPGAIGAQTATSYRPPQQTERANPLTGGNNIPLPTTSVPFSQRGGASVQGQDAAAMDAADEEDMGTQGRIGSAMQGTFDRLRGAAPRSLFSPRFRQPSAPQPSYLDRIFRATPDMQP